MDIHKVTVTVAQPRGNFYGRVEYGYYTVVDDVVTLVEPNGLPVDRYKLIRKLKPGEDVKGVACALTHQRYSKAGDGSFNRPLQYPRQRF